MVEGRDKGVLASVGDVRMLRSGRLLGASRLARHLWRMSFALFIAALSFLAGQAKVIPEPIRIPALLALPVLAVLATMLYWLWRVRIRRTFRGIAGLRRRHPGRRVKRHARSPRVRERQHTPKPRRE